MRRLVMAALIAALAASATLSAPAGAQEGEPPSPLPPLRIGDQFPFSFQVELPPGATVEVDTVAPSWGFVQVVRIDAIDYVEGATSRVATVHLILATFAPGEVQFRPAVLVVNGPDAEGRTLEPVALAVVSTLGENEPLTLSPLPPPREIAGARPWYTLPAIAGAAVTAVAAVAALAWRSARWWRSRPRRPAVPAAPAPVLDLAGAVASLESDPVAAYRALGATVRSALASRYGFPARALTTAELAGRMESEGVDRWQARLVGGLLEECDAVVYAGYRPAIERRQADLNMAREILEVE